MGWDVRQTIHEVDDSGILELDESSSWEPLGILHTQRSLGGRKREVIILWKKQNLL